MRGWPLVTSIALGAWPRAGPVQGPLASQWKRKAERRASAADKFHIHRCPDSAVRAARGRLVRRSKNSRERRRVHELAGAPVLVRDVPANFIGRRNEEFAEQHCHRPMHRAGPDAAQPGQGVLCGPIKFTAAIGGQRAGKMPNQIVEIGGGIRRR
jgi:hypothetical protein